MAASGAHGGLALLVKTDPLFAVLSHRSVSHRVLVTHLRVGPTLQCRLVCAHAPIQDAPDAEHAAFALHIREALSHVQPGELVFAGVDLNARLKGLHEDFTCVGPHAFSECSHRAQHRHSCLAEFDKASLIALNTMIPQDDAATWKHTSAAEFQIDFVFVPQKLAAQNQTLSSSVGDWAWFDCATTSDHRHVSCTLMLSLAPHISRGSKRRRLAFVNDQHVHDYTVTMAAELPCWTADQDPCIYMQNALQLMESSVVATKPVRPAPNKPWVTPETWDSLYTLNRWRRLLAAWRRHDWA
eukprot:589774-Amphidinium_carterae.1